MGIYSDAKISLHGLPFRGEKDMWEERRDAGLDAHICSSSVLLEIRSVCPHISFPSVILTNNL